MWNRPKKPTVDELDQELMAQLLAAVESMNAAVQRAVEKLTP